MYNRAINLSISARFAKANMRSVVYPRRYIFVLISIICLIIFKVFLDVQLIIYLAYMCFLLARFLPTLSLFTKT